jgi:hypothetical protein
LILAGGALQITNAAVAFDDRNDRSLGYGHVAFAAAEEAANAVRMMHNREVGGRALQVYVAKTKGERVTSQAPIPGVDMRAMRFNPASGGQYGVSKEKMTLRFARELAETSWEDMAANPKCAAPRGCLARAAARASRLPRTLTLGAAWKVPRRRRGRVDGPANRPERRGALGLGVLQPRVGQVGPGRA